MKKITITIEDDNSSINPYNGSNIKLDNGWVDGIDICDTCPNRPGGPNNKSGFCNCVIPSIYEPYRITC